MEIKTSEQIESELISAQEHGTEDSGVLLKEISEKKWVSVKEVKEKIEQLINAKSGCEMGFSPDFVRDHFALQLEEKEE